MSDAPVCVVTTQRTGSTWFMQLLNASPGLKAYGEIFREIASDQFAGDPRLRPPMFYKEFRQGGSGGRRGGVGGYLDLIAADAGIRPAFKVMYDQLRARPEIGLGLLAKRCRFVHLVRRNSLDVVISKNLMKQKRLIHSTRPVDIPTIRIEPGLFMRQLGRIDLQVRAVSALLAAAPGGRLTVAYEDLIHDPQEELWRVADFAGLPRFPFVEDKDNWRKTNTRAPAEVVENFAEVSAAIGRSRFRSLLSYARGESDPG